MARIDSRDIGDLRADVGARVRLFTLEMEKLGFLVGVSSTLRNDEQQIYLYASGRTRAGQIVTNSKVTTFHGVGLAFDIFQNVTDKTKRYNDPKFWVAADRLLADMGFSRLSSEKCHAQWSAGGKYTGNQVRAGILPPTMPLYSTHSALAASVAGKIGLSSVDYWKTAMDDKIAVNTDYIKTVLVRVCNKAGKQYSMPTVASALGLSDPAYWQSVVDGKAKPTGALVVALFEKIDKVF